MKDDATQDNGQKVCPANLLFNDRILEEIGRTALLAIVLRSIILYSRKTEMAHCVFVAVLTGTNTFKISATSSSDIVRNRVSSFLAHCFFVFRE